MKQLFVMVVYLNDRSARLSIVKSEESQQRFLEGVTVSTVVIASGELVEGGWLFDATMSRVEPPERPHKGERHCGERRYTEVSAGP